jgi:hypothetical protein
MVATALMGKRMEEKAKRSHFVFTSQGCRVTMAQP